jgi:MinD superfamily P-loop ATPase
VIDENRCTHCGLCSRACAFNALAVFPSQVLIFPQLCHGCGGCAIACPEKAISEGSRPVGSISRAISGGIELIWGELNVGEARATPLIRAVRELARGDAVIVDCPPGTSCSMVESVRGTNFCLLVTEPTPFGLYDLKIALKVLEKMDLPHGVLVNKCGIGDMEVYRYLEKRSIPLMMEIPLDRKIAELYSRGRVFVEDMPSWKARFRCLFEDIEEMVA